VRLGAYVYEYQLPKQNRSGRSAKVAAFMGPMEVRGGEVGSNRSGLDNGDESEDDSGRHELDNNQAPMGDVEEVFHHSGQPLLNYDEGCLSSMAQLGNTNINPYLDPKLQPFARFSPDGWFPSGI
jgi:hypothetical protein